jgi:hypothetical protein
VGGPPRAGDLLLVWRLEVTRPGWAAF